MKYMRNISGYVAACFVQKTKFCYEYRVIINLTNA